MRVPRLLAACLAAFAVSLAIAAGPAGATVVHPSDGAFAGIPGGGSAYVLGLAAGGPEGGSEDSVYVSNQTFTTGFKIYKFTETGKYANVEITGASTAHGSLAMMTGLESGGMAVDSTKGENAGDLYVADVENNVVDKFGPKGAFKCEITGMATPGVKECDLSGSDTSAGGFEGFEPRGVAVNAVGDVYVADVRGDVIDEFGPKGNYITTIANAAITHPAELAVGQDEGAEALYIVNGGNLISGGSDVVEYRSGKFTTFGSEAPRTVAYYAHNGHVYVQNNSGEQRIEEFTAKDGLWSTFGRGVLEVYPGYLGISAATGNVYMAFMGAGLKSEVAMFGPGVVVPNIAIEAPTVVENESAVFHGEVEPDTAHGGSEVESCRFEYVTEQQYAKGKWAEAEAVPCEPSAPYTSNAVVSAEAQGLSELTKYYVRLTAKESLTKNTAGYSEEPEYETFKTTGPPTITTAQAEERTRSGAKLSARVNPEEAETHYQFEYVTAEAYAEHASNHFEGAVKMPASPGTIAAGKAAVRESVELTKLPVGAEYYARVWAENEHGTTEDVFPFSVVPVAGVEFQSALAGPTTATIKASVNPTMGLPPLKDATTCELEYVTEAQHEASGYATAEEEGHVLPCVSRETMESGTPGVLGAESGAQNVIVKLTGLSTDTVYDYRFVVKNESGEGITERQLATFGITAGGLSGGLLGGGEEPYTRAGGHPFALVTTVKLHANEDGVTSTQPSGRLKDVRVELPPGVIGNPSAVAKCSRYHVTHRECSTNEQVGVMTLDLANDLKPNERVNPTYQPLFNVTPPAGVAAEFAASYSGFVATIDASVRTGGDYGIDAESLNVPTEADVVGVTVTMWGVPGDPRHNVERRACLEPTGSGYRQGLPEEEGTKNEPCVGQGGMAPFLTAPVSCAGPLHVKAEVDSYNRPGEYVPAEATMSDGMKECGRLRFDPSLTVTPETHAADSPSGLEVDLRVPQEESAETPVEADLKDATVTLPAGVTVNPSSASGLTGCPLLSGKEAHPGVSGIDMEDGEAAKCPASSKIGTVELETPLFPGRHFDGGIYVAQQSANPFGSLIALYIGIDEPQRGVVIKLAGHVQLSEKTGQLTTTFENNPQLPFEELRLHFFGGQRAALATPRACGTYEATSSLEPWSHQGAPGEEGTPDATPLSKFAISSCAGAGAFQPSFTAGTSENQGAAFSPFTMTLARKDGEQRLGTVELTMPAGMSAMISKVPQCPTAAAATGACPAASQIGHVVTEVGVGGQPDTLPEAGRAEDPVYLTQGYGGAPFGLLFVVHAEAGPFNLGTVLVHAKILVNPLTAQVTIQAEKMPSMLQGIPVDLKALHVVVNHPGFMFNPTSCAVKQVAGAIASQEGAVADVASRFQAAGCRGLAFQPKLTVATSSHFSRKDGTSLHVKIAYPTGSTSQDANLRYVKVALPEGLPSREETLKQACTEAQFKANPAGCPAGSVVGHAVVRTPVLPVPLTGPAYFVSHGGAQWPELVMLLQGDGVTIQLNGKTHISKGVTTSTFPANPDVPFSTFNLYLPRGPHSALSFNGNLCYIHKHHKTFKRHMKMPTTMIGQNGARIEQSTPVYVDGCGNRIEKRKVRVKGNSATIVVHVPYAGRLTANGKGISKVSKRIKKQGGRMALTVHLKHRFAKKLRHSHRNHIKVRVHLRFGAPHHRTLTATVNVNLH